MALGYEETGPGTGEEVVMKLCKSRYGLRQSPQNWWDTIDVYLMETGFLPLKTDPCLYVFLSTDSQQQTVPVADGHRHVVVVLTL